MAQINFPGLYVPTSNVWDSGQIEQTDANSPEFKQLIVRLYQNLNQIALSLNAKETGYYDTLELINGQQFFPNPAYSSQSSTAPVYRSVFRKVINFGALPNAATKSVPHGIAPIGLNSSFTFTRIYGTSSKTSTQNYIPIPYSSGTLNKNIEINVDGTNVNITTSIDYSLYIVTYIILEYLRT
jgi:hypothetical protein